MLPLQEPRQQKVQRPRMSATAETRIANAVVGVLDSFKREIYDRLDRHEAKLDLRLEQHETKLDEVPLLKQDVVFLKAELERARQRPLTTWQVVTAAIFLLTSILGTFLGAISLIITVIFHFAK